MAETTNNANLEKLKDGFGIVTVMNARIYTLTGEGASYLGDTPLLPSNFQEVAFIDTLKIANITAEGPTKTITGGQYSNPLIKYGKTMTIEMQDALGRVETLEHFFGCAVDKATGTISVGDKFPGALAIQGETFFIDQSSGDQVPVYIFIPQMLPDGLFNLTQDAEGDATVFDLNGSLSVTKIAEDSTDTTGSKVFYQIRMTPFVPLTKT